MDRDAELPPPLPVLLHDLRGEEVVDLLRDVFLMSAGMRQSGAGGREVMRWEVTGAG